MDSKDTTPDEDAVPSPASSTATDGPASQVSSPAPKPVMEPLSAEPYEVQFTATQQLLDKIEQARDLLQQEVPDGDIAEICERALDLLMARIRN